ncbi:MAG: hypothetical protein WC052_05590 [Patescibacteria group bacterium]
MILYALQLHDDHGLACNIIDSLDRDEFTKAICDTFAAKFPKSDYLCRIPDQFKTKEMCMSSVITWPYNLGFVPAFLQTEEMCIATIERSPDAIEYVYHQTHELCMLAFKSAARYGGEIPNIYGIFDNAMMTPLLISEMIDVNPDVVHELDSVDLWKVLPKLLSLAREICKSRTTEPQRWRFDITSRIKCQKIRRCIVQILTAEKLSALLSQRLSTLCMLEIIAEYATTAIFGSIMRVSSDRMRYSKLDGPRPILSWADCWALAKVIKTQPRLDS